jgi:hypothetical protein
MRLGERLRYGTATGLELEAREIGSCLRGSYRTRIAKEEIGFRVRVFPSSSRQWLPESRAMLRHWELYDRGRNVSRTLRPLMMFFT